MRSELDNAAELTPWFESDTNSNTKYGFNWGPMKVIRAARFAGRAKHPGSRVVIVETKYENISVYVSDGGRSVRVFKDGKELK